MNERILLRFHEFDPAKARAMLDIAADFAVSKIDGRPGFRAGTAYRNRYGVFWAYWTGSRVVVVREHGPKETA